MKKHAFLVLGIILLSLYSQAQTNDSPLISEMSTAYYGKKITFQNAISTKDLLAAMQTHDSLVTKVKGEIIASCKKKGCWMDMQLPDGQTMKITFKDYAFFVPKGMTKNYGIIEGVAKKETISVAMLRHYAQDAGKSKEEIEKITTPKTTITFEAIGVIIE
jgi:hypothetical protein